MGSLRCKGGPYDGRWLANFIADGQKTLVFTCYGMKGRYLNVKNQHFRWEKKV